MRNSIKYFFYAFGVMILFSFSFGKYSNPIELILKNLDSYATNYSPNKIYLQTDRPLYALEDTVWFKVYALDASYHQSKVQDKVIYVDIVDSNDNKVLSRKLHTENMTAASDFLIERDWSPGKYKLRAYTKFMLNQDQEYIYNKDIQIIDINKASDEVSISLDSGISKQLDPPSKSLELKFFPESGDLIDGIDSRVAIKIENYSPELGDVSGVIEDEAGNRIAPFNIFETGYGMASFRPEAGKKYVARLDNDPKVYPLPEVKIKAYHIMVLSKQDNVSIIVTSTIKSGLSNGDILVHSRGRLVYHKKLDEIDKDSYGLNLNTKEMPTGVTHITFFDKNGIPRSERLFFIDNTLTEAITKTDKSLYSQREKVDLNLSLNNNNQKSFDCSVSVFDKSSLKENQPSENIKSWMLLNSDLRGKINNPAFYFEKIGDRKKSILLDLVMMTHGWRRFTWEDMSKESIDKDLEHERELGIYIKGNTSKLFNDKKPIKSNVMLNFFNDSYQEQITTEADGRFAFGPFIIQDSVAAIIQAGRHEKNEKDFLGGNRKLEINIDALQYLNLEKPLYEENSGFDFKAYKKFISTNKNSQALKDQYHDMEVRLSEVVFTAKRKTEEEEMNEIVRETSSYIQPSNRVRLDDLQRKSNTSIYEVLRDVPGLIINGVYPNQTIAIRGLSSANLGFTPLFLFDGVPVGEEFIKQMGATNVLFIDVLKGSSAAGYGVRGANGVIAIYSANDSEISTTKNEPGIVNINIKGFDGQRQFYSPDYAKNVSSVYEPDVRTTLYWNPNVILSEGEENSISFFTGDNTGNYVVISEGLSTDGELIFSTHEFEVQEN